jgi:hypothetical protein
MFNAENLNYWTFNILQSALCTLHSANSHPPDRPLHKITHGAAGAHLDIPADAGGGPLAVL